MRKEIHPPQKPQSQARPAPAQPPTHRPSVRKAEGERPPVRHVAVLGYN